MLVSNIFIQSALFLIASAMDFNETSPFSQFNVHKCTQETLTMVHFFSKMNFQFIQSTKLYRNPHNVCGKEDQNSWKFVTCVNGKVTKYIHHFDTIGARLAHEKDSIGNFQIAWLPQSVQELSIAHTDQHYSVDTRMFPREARVLLMHANRIFGSINLTCLPTALRVFNLGENDIEGIINLTMLPGTMEYLYLYTNRIQQDSACIANLPENIKVLRIGKDKFEERNQVRVFYALAKDLRSVRRVLKGDSPVRCA